ncbi:stealth family protein [Salinibacterium sp. SYSU T00001]|uniref:stealth family protein n=1 Tax=Homoserinimonas sedimenticola TaxID=2986805 RepID=UPI002235EFBF|nr:stealth family protein [Salinibacterium sedimenticola]MCW4386196.1 stealth family protein [Salinibacterium sedimenticola]
MNVFSSLSREGNAAPADPAVVVTRSGMLTIVGSGVTPWQAFREDLDFVRAVLEGAGIDFFLVRDTDPRPTVVVDWADRGRLAAALAAACRQEPFYSRTEKMAKAAKADIAARARGVVSGTASEHIELAASDSAGADPVLFSAENEADVAVTPILDAVTPSLPERVALLAHGRLSRDRSARAFTLFRPREAQTGTLRYGAECGVPLELWQHVESRRVRPVGDGGATLVVDDVIAPRPNVLLRHSTPSAELERATVELYGEEWPTLKGMFDTTSDDVTFDIDIVFSWVDGSSAEFQRQRAKRMASYVVGEGDDHEARFRQLDELKYAMRSVHLFAPWIRNIYIVTDSPRPEWLAEHPRVSVLRSEEFFRDPSVLPTHNSHAVESQLHNIKGLSEHFLYSNDDMFFGRAVGPEMFFSPGGVSKFILSNTRIGVGERNPNRSGFENAARVNREVLRERFGVTITRHLEHAAAPLRRSVLRELEAEFPEEFARTAAAQFRQATDVSVTNSLYHYYALMTGQAVTQPEAKVRYVDTTAREGVKRMRQLLKRRNHDFFCLNDGSFPELDGEERAQAVRWFLERYFPIPAPWERPAV